MLNPFTYSLQILRVMQSNIIMCFIIISGQIKSLHELQVNELEETDRLKKKNRHWFNTIRKCLVILIAALILGGFLQGEQSVNINYFDYFRVYAKSCCKCPKIYARYKIMLKCSY